MRLVWTRAAKYSSDTFRILLRYVHAERGCQVVRLRIPGRSSLATLRASCSSTSTRMLGERRTVCTRLMWLYWDGWKMLRLARSPVRPQNPTSKPDSSAQLGPANFWPLQSLLHPPLEKEVVIPPALHVSSRFWILEIFGLEDF